ncbi:hypothetical protein [Daejeonella oryzae]|uniref:hypothetical protein n=1 Tax=Daejeonella oryzae TaxID=1122943 RepID=UPI00041FC9B1|nr:hypothetical protein [Daejeonella oryzae]
MKQYIMTIIAVFTIMNIYAQTKTLGYYITHENDTVVTQIKFPNGLLGQNNFTNLIEVVDSSNAQKRFTPVDIKGYGYSADGRKYVFLSKPVKDGSFRFLSPVFVGSKASLYQYGTSTSGSGYALPSQKIYYTFEKPDHRYLFLVGQTTKKFKNELKEFFKDDPDVLQLIDEKLKYWLEMKKDLLEIMQTANK